jgi:hypothetical protein
MGQLENLCLSCQLVQKKSFGDRDELFNPRLCRDLQEPIDGDRLVLLFISFSKE